MWIDIMNKYVLTHFQYTYVNYVNTCHHQYMSLYYVSMSTTRERSVKTSRSFFILYIFKISFYFIYLVRTYTCHSIQEVRGQFARFSSLLLASRFKGWNVIHQAWPSHRLVLQFLRYNRKKSSFCCFQTKSWFFFLLITGDTDIISDGI